MTWADFFDLITSEHRVFGLDWSYLVLLGLVGNATFSSRFLLQWIHSERAGRSLIPKMFWHFSIAGSLILLLYFILRRDPVGILANLPNALIYMRNLQLVKREERAAS